MAIYEDRMIKLKQAGQALWPTKDNKTSEKKRTRRYRMVALVVETY